jgi:hypothetical protein
MKNAKVIVIASVILVGGYFLFKNFFKKSVLSEEENIINQLEELNLESVNLWEKKDYANSIKVSNEGLTLVEQYLKQFEGNSNFTSKLGGYKLNFLSTIKASNIK